MCGTFWDGESGNRALPIGLVGRFSLKVTCPMIKAALWLAVFGIAVVGDAFSRLFTGPDLE